MNKRPRKLFVSSLMLLFITFFSGAGLQANVMLENFEGVVTPFSPGWGGALTINSIGKTGAQAAPGSSNSLQITYTVNGAMNNVYEYQHRRLNVGNKDLRNCKELRFWLKGDGTTKNRLFFYLVENGAGLPADGEMFKNAQYGGNATTFDLSSTQWRLFRVPLSQNSFTRNSNMWFAGGFGPDSNSVSRYFSGNLGAIIFCLSGDQPIANSTIYIDDIEGVWDNQPTLIEDFEHNSAGLYNNLIEYAWMMRNEVGERNVNAARDGWNFSSGSTASLSADSVNKHDGNQSLKINYQLSNGNNKYIMLLKLLGGKEWDVSHNYRRCQDWSGYGGIRFWYQGDGSYGAVGPYENSTSPYNIMRVRIDARGKSTANGPWWGGDSANNFPFEADIPLEIYGWRQRYIPFSMMGVWADNIDPFTPPDAVDLSAVKLLALAIRDSPGGKVADTDNSNVYMDQVELYTKTAPSEAKVFEGIKAEICPVSGLLYTFDGLIESHTYDNALAAMCFVLKGDQAKAEAIFDRYKIIHDAGPFNGFYYAYNASSGAPMKAEEGGLLGRGAGPCAFMLMALMYYEDTFGVNPSYNTMIINLANWLKGLQVVIGPGFGKVQWGYDYAGAARTMGSVEVNADCYAALARYAIKTGDLSFQTAAQNIKTWLNTMWILLENRFKIGDTVGNINDKALDVYSIPVLALMNPDAFYGRQGTDPMYSNCLAAAEATPKFVVPHTDLWDSYSLYTGNYLDGFDFGGPTGNSPDGDGIWFEGTAQMACAFHLVGDDLKRDKYLVYNGVTSFGIEGGITDMCGPGAQGITYATPFIPSTGYGPTAFDGSASGWPMAVTNAHIGSMCWYIFAKNDFNPLWPGGAVPPPPVVIVNQAMKDRVTQGGAGGWNNLANGGSIWNDEEVEVYAQITSTGTLAMRFYYTADNTAPLTNKDNGGDVGTSFYVVGTAGGLGIFTATIKEAINNCNNVIKWKPCGSIDNGVTWPVNGAEWSYLVNQPGSVIGDRDLKILVGRGANTMPGAKPYPLVWNPAGYFEDNVENDYSALRHTPMPIPGISAATTQLMTLMSPTTDYYFMPENTNTGDNVGLNSSHFTTTTSDGYVDIFYGQNPYLYVRTSYGDALVTGSSIEFGYGAPGVTGPATAPPSGFTGSLVYSTEYAPMDPVAGPWNWVETIASNNPAYLPIDEWKKHLNAGRLHYDFMRPDNAAMPRMAGLPEGTTVYYCFMIRDEAAGGQAWKKQLNAEGVYNENTSNKKYFSYSLLQDDLSCPYVKYTIAPIADSTALRPQKVTDSGNCSWVNNYVINAELYDFNDGHDSFSPSLFDNVLPGSGSNSGIYHNPDPNAVGAANCPVHDTRVYYRISVSSPTVLDGYQPSDKYITGGTATGYYYIPNTAVESNTYDFNDANNDGLGYAQMTGNESGGLWTAHISLRENYAGRNIYYRIFACNNDHDPQGYKAPSDNHVPVAVNPTPVTGFNDIGATFNNHGVVGAVWTEPYNVSPGDACDSDRDHNWVTLTRYGGMITGPKLVKIKAKVTIRGITKNIVAYVNAEGGTVGNIIYTEMEKDH